MISQRFSRLIGAGLTALMVTLVPVSAFADDGGGHAGRGRRNGFQQSFGCTSLESALQTAPNLAYYSGVQALLSRCGMPVQPAASQPVCPNLMQAMGEAPDLHRFPGVVQQLRNCLLPQGSGQQGLGQPTAPVVAPIGGQFNDLGGWSWALNDINILASMGIVDGIAPHHYAPAAKLTRAQFAALMKRVFNLSVPTSPATFVDVQPGAWYYADVEAAASYMSSFNTPGGVAFEPGIDVTRIEVAATIGKILVQENQAQLPSQAQAQATFAQFNDGNLVPAGLEQYAAVAVTMGFMKGLPNGYFGVENALDRAQAAVLLVRVLRSSESMNGIAPGASSTYSVNGTLSSISGQQVVVATAGGSTTLDLASSYTVTLNGSASSLGALADGDAVTLTVDSTTDQVTAIAATTSTTATYSVSGTLTSVNGQQLVVSTSAGPLTLNLASSYTVTLNGSASSLGSLVDGDAVTLTVESATSQVTAIAASGTASGSYTVSGTLASVNGQQLVVNTSTGTQTFNLASSYTVTLNGSASSLGSLVDGEAVTLTVDSSTSQVTAIAASGTASGSYTVSGTLTSVNGQQLVVDTSTGSVTLSVESNASVTLNGSAASLGALVAGDAVTLTVLSSVNQVTAVTATSTATQTVTGYIVAESGSVSVSVYTTSSGIQNYTLVSGATVTLNGQVQSSITGVPLGDLATVSLESQNQATLVAATTPSPAPVTGAYEGLNGGTISLFSGGTLESVAAGAAPVVYVNGAVSALTSTSVSNGTAVTVDPAGANGSALVITG